MRLFPTILARSASKEHIHGMATKSSDSATPKRDGRDAKVLGRSAATGRYVLKPASKGGSTSYQDVKTAVKSVSGGKKKK